MSTEKIKMNTWARRGNNLGLTEKKVVTMGYSWEMKVSI